MDARPSLGVIIEVCGGLAMAGRTERLYQRDSFLTRFTAAVLDARAERSADPSSSVRLAVLLDRTTFYPTGGGQPHDTGTLGGLPVVETRESEEGPLHLVELRDQEGRAHGAHFTVGGEVEGIVDWDRRFDHMQQHSGQHILSRAFLEVVSARTRSFHLGEAICTIDVDMPRPSAEAILAAEARANQIVWEDRPVAVREILADPIGPGAQLDRGTSGLDRAPGEPTRFVEIEGFDSNACCGTHVARTGQVGLIGAIAWEPYKGICRVTFVCGGRALRHIRETNASLGACVVGLSAPLREIPAALERLLAEREDLLRRVRALGAALAEREAAQIAVSAPTLGPFRLLRGVYRHPERSVDEVQILARRFVEEPGRLALVAVVEGETATILAGRSSAAAGVAPAGADLPKMGEVIAEVCRTVGGRGGGSPTFARAGGVPAGRVEEALDAIAARLLAGAGCEHP